MRWALHAKIIVVSNARRCDIRIIVIVPMLLFLL